MDSIWTISLGSLSECVVAQKYCPAGTYLHLTARSPLSSRTLQLDDQVADPEVEQLPNPDEDRSLTRYPEVDRLAVVHDRYCRLFRQL